VHVCNPSSEEAQAGGLQVQGQPGLHSETLPKRKKKHFYCLLVTFAKHNIVLFYCLFIYSYVYTLFGPSLPPVPYPLPFLPPPPLLPGNIIYFKTDV
jgi:hypothetical protein